MGFEAARSLPDGSWNSKHEAGKLGGLPGRAEREGAARGPLRWCSGELAGLADAGPGPSIGREGGAAFSYGNRRSRFSEPPPNHSSTPSPLCL